MRSTPRGPRVLRSHYAVARKCARAGVGSSVTTRRKAPDERSQYSARRTPSPAHPTRACRGARSASCSISACASCSARRLRRHRDAPRNGIVGIGPAMARDRSPRPPRHDDATVEYRGRPGAVVSGSSSRLRQSAQGLIPALGIEERRPEGVGLGQPRLGSTERRPRAPVVPSARPGSGRASGGILVGGVDGGPSRAQLRLARIFCPRSSSASVGAPAVVRGQLHGTSCRRQRVDRLTAAQQHLRELRHRKAEFGSRLSASCSKGTASRNRPAWTSIWAAAKS